MKSPKTVFLLGAGGMGMAPLALYLNGAGIRVEAFDDHFVEPVRTQLLESGVEVIDEPLPRNPPDCVIRSSAIDKESEYLKPFLKRRVPIFRRGDFVARFTAHRKVLAVVGSHGKTTTAGMLVWALEEIGHPVSYLVGGRFEKDTILPGQFIRDSWVVLEVDESDGSIDGFSPSVTLALNSDWDHVDQYSAGESFEETLKNLFTRTSHEIVVPRKSKLQEIAESIDHDSVTCFYPRSEESADFLSTNQAAAFAAGKSMGFDLSEVDFNLFPGMKRRQSVLFESESRIVMEDYAHHPTEVRSFLSQRRILQPEHFLRVIFQPHRFSRTEKLAKLFAEELSLADDLYLLPTYGAFEKFDPAGAVEALTGYLAPRLRKETVVFDDFTDLRSALGSSLESSKKDQIVFVGAGDLERWAHAFAAFEKTNGNKHDAFSCFLADRLSPTTILRANIPLGSKTTMKVGGSARWYAEPAHSEDLRMLVDACELFGIPRVMMGRGSNLIVPDQGYGGLVLRLKGSFWKEISLRSDNNLIVGAGARLQEICRYACKNGLVGFEFLEGIPGTLGGALRMNAGAMGWETFDLVEWVSFLLPDGSIRKIPGTDLTVGYRYCREAYEGIALRAKLRAEGRSDHRAIRTAIDKLASKRRSTQPRESSAGCIFRNPEETPAGKLIDQLGLKGEREGSAVVSNLHANFIVNEGGATAEEVISLIKRVRERVRETRGLLLEPEVGILGKDWNEYLS